MKLTRMIAVAAFCLPAFASEHILQLTPENTQVSWTLGAVLHTVHGTFKVKHGVVRFDPESGQAAGEVTIDVSSGDSGSGARDKRMHANVLESARYPDAVFVPDRIEGPVSMTGASHARLHGTFTIHGASHELTMDAQLNVASGQINADLTCDIPYVAWGMKDPSTFILKVGKSVEMKLHTVAPIQ